MRFGQIGDFRDILPFVKYDNAIDSRGDRYVMNEGSPVRRKS